MIPEKIGRYEIQSELGRGGMATVFQAYDPLFERIVAVKVLPREFMHEPEFRARFEREAKTIAALEHPAIVSVYDFGEEDGQPYLVMRHMPGGSLTDRLQEGPISIPETARILNRIGDALDRAHSQGIIHRDLKPSNILFDQYGEAYLADFGIVHLSTSSSAALTASGSLVGTPAYMSPEQVYGDKELDGRSDIYALGVILFQMLTGGTPYSADTPARMMMKHVMDPVPLILEKRPDLPPECDKVITKAMAKNREERYPTATEMSLALTTATQKLIRPEIPPELETPVTPDTPLPEGIKPESIEVEKAVAEPIRVAPEPVEEIKPAPVKPSFVEPDVPGRYSVPQPEPRSRLSIPIWVWGLVGLLVVICIGAIGVASWWVSNDGLAFFGDSATNTPTGPATVTTIAILPATEPSQATPEPTREIDTSAATEEASGRLATATARAVLQLTAVAGAETPTVAGENDATRDSALATRQALAEISVAATATARASFSQDVQFPPLFGPESGELTHEIDEFIETSNAGLNLSDFMVTTTFYNPFDGAIDGWDFGIIFRQEDVDEELRLVIRSDGSWSLNNRQGDIDEFIHEDVISGNLRLDDGQSNKITLIAQNGRGFFFMNDRFISLLDLSSRTNAGDIVIGTGFYGSSEREGATTAYDGFSAWSLETAFGPASSQLDHVDDGLIKVRAAGVDLVNFMADVVFTNPYPASRGGWDVGFSFRNLEVDDQFWLIVDSLQEWSFIDRQSGDDVFIDEGSWDDIDLGPNGENRLTLIALNDLGYFFINDAFVATLDLSNRVESGDIEVVTAFFIDNEIDGEATEYQNFTLWPLP